MSIDLTGKPAALAADGVAGRGATAVVARDPLLSDLRHGLQPPH